MCALCIAVQNNSQHLFG